MSTDPDTLLRRIRRDLTIYGDLLDKPADATERLLRAVRDLDDHLTAGGRPPEAWREGPDAPGVDEPNEDANAGPWREATEQETVDYLAGHLSRFQQARETEHGLEIRDA